MGVTVRRGEGDRPGDQIVSAALTTIDAQRFRAVQELDENDSDRENVSGVIIGTQTAPAPGDIIAISDQQGIKNGYLERISFRIEADPYGITTNIQAEQVK